MTPPPRSVLVLGAQGRFGAAAVQAFAAAGWQVLAQMRRAPASALPAGARALALSLDEPAAAERAAAGASVVVYAINPPYSAWHSQLLPLARQGMDLAERLGARLLLPGNVYNFGSGMPALLQEGTAQQADTAKGRLRRQLEDELAERCTRGLQATVLRAGDFFGAGRGSWLDLVIAKGVLQARGRGRWVYPGPLDKPHAWTYLPDLARAMVALAEQPPVAAFERLHFGGHSVTGAELLDALDRSAIALGLRAAPATRGGFPWRLIRAGGLFVPMWRELAEMAYLWQQPHALDGRLLARRLPGLAHTPLQQALQQSLAELMPAPRPAAAPTHVPTGA